MCYLRCIAAMFARRLRPVPEVSQLGDVLDSYLNHITEKGDISFHKRKELFTIDESGGTFEAKRSFDGLWINHSVTREKSALCPLTVTAATSARM